LDPHPFHADLDPFHADPDPFHADPDSGFETFADPDSTIQGLKYLQIRIRIQGWKNRIGKKNRASK